MPKVEVHEAENGVRRMPTQPSWIMEEGIVVEPETRRVTVQTPAGPVEVDITIHLQAIVETLVQAAVVNKGKCAVISRDDKPLVTARRAGK